jgi:hypothetical protein
MKEIKHRYIEGNRRKEIIRFSFSCTNPSVICLYRQRCFCQMSRRVFEHEMSTRVCVCAGGKQIDIMRPTEANNTRLYYIHDNSESKNFFVESISLINRQFPFVYLLYSCFSLLPIIPVTISFCSRFTVNISIVIWHYLLIKAYVYIKVIIVEL